MTTYADNKLKLSEHFTVAEATKSYVADRLGIDNRLPIQYLNNAKFIAEELLEPAREYFEMPYSPLSFYRCELLCRGISRNKSNKTTKRISQHTLALATDLRIEGVPLLELLRYFYVFEDFDQLILEFYDPSRPDKGWVHVSKVQEKAKNRNQFLFTTDGITYHDAEKLNLFSKRCNIDINGKMGACQW
jgi:zinc D-Ala-D-Ala carboxypeptidase